MLYFIWFLFFLSFLYLSFLTSTQVLLLFAFNRSIFILFHYYYYYFFKSKSASDKCLENLSLCLVQCQIFYYILFFLFLVFWSINPLTHNDVNYFYYVFIGKNKRIRKQNKSTLLRFMFVINLRNNKQTYEPTWNYF